MRYGYWLIPQIPSVVKILAYAILEIGFVLIYARWVVNTRLFETSWTRTNADSAFLRLSLYPLSYGFIFGKSSRNRTESNSFGDYCANHYTTDLYYFFGETWVITPLKLVLSPIHIWRVLLESNQSTKICSLRPKHSEQTPTRKSAVANFNPFLTRC